MPSLVWCFKSQNRYDYGFNMSFYYLPHRDDPHIQLFANTSSVLVDKYNETLEFRQLTGDCYLFHLYITIPVQTGDYKKFYVIFNDTVTDRDMPFEQELYLTSPQNSYGRIYRLYSSVFSWFECLISNQNVFISVIGIMEVHIESK